MKGVEASGWSRLLLTLACCALMGASKNATVPECAGVIDCQQIEKTLRKFSGTPVNDGDDVVIVLRDVHGEFMTMLARDIVHVAGNRVLLKKSAKIVRCSEGTDWRSRATNNQHLRDVIDMAHQLGGTSSVKDWDAASVAIAMKWAPRDVLEYVLLSIHDSADVKHSTIPCIDGDSRETIDVLEVLKP